MTQYLSETSRDGQTKKLCTSIQHESRVWKNCSRVRVKTVDKSYSENVRVIMVNKQTLLTTTIVPQRCIPFLLRPALDVHCSVVFIHCVYSFFFFMYYGQRSVFTFCRTERNENIETGVFREECTVDTVVCVCVCVTSGPSRDPSPGSGSAARQPGRVAMTIVGAPGLTRGGARASKVI